MAEALTDYIFLNISTCFSLLRHATDDCVWSCCPVAQSPSCSPALSLLKPPLLANTTHTRDGDRRLPLGLPLAPCLTITHMGVRLSLQYSSAEKNPEKHCTWTILWFSIFPPEVVDIESKEGLGSCIRTLWRTQTVYIINNWKKIMENTLLLIPRMKV